MNGNSRTKQGVLEKHDSLQTVQAPTPRVLTIAVKRGLHSMLPGQSNPRPAKKQVRRGFGAKKATISFGEGKVTPLPAAHPEGEEGVQPGVGGEPARGEGKT